jgi:hypothetical protein
MDLMSWLVMRPPIPQLGLDLFFFGSLYFLPRSPLLLSRGSLGKASRGFILKLLLSAAFTPQAFSPFFPQGKVQPLNDWLPYAQTSVMGWVSEEIRWKVVCVARTDDGSSEIPPVATQNLWTQACYGILSFPPDMVKWTSIRSKHLLETKESNAHIQRF